MAVAAEIKKKTGRSAKAGLQFTRREPPPPAAPPTAEEEDAAAALLQKRVRVHQATSGADAVTLYARERAAPEPRHRQRAEQVRVLLAEIRDDGSGFVHCWPLLSRGRARDWWLRLGQERNLLTEETTRGFLALRRGRDKVRPRGRR